MKQLIPAAALLSLAACASAHSLNEGERLNWRCDGGATFSLRQTSGAVEVFAAGQTHRLRRVEDGRYSNGTVDYVEGDGATLTGANGGPYENCHRTGLLRRLM